MVLEDTSENEDIWTQNFLILRGFFGCFFVRLFFGFVFVFPENWGNLPALNQYD